jgi:hypothetical protein
MDTVILILAVIAYLAFHQWLRSNRRTMIHRERLAAIEKGVELPPLEQEVRRTNWGVQRILLLAGLIWVSLGVGLFVTLTALLAFPSPASREIPQGVQWIGIAPICIGLSHLFVYWVGRQKENQ